MNNNKRFNYTIMKNVRFVTLAVAMLAAVSLVSSCSKSDDSVKPVVVSVADENCSIIATSNAEVTYSIDVPATKTISTDKSNTAYFTGIAAGTKVAKVTAKLVNADGYEKESQTAIVNFSSNINCASIAFVFTKKPTETKSQSDVAASTSDIVFTAQLFDIEAQLIIPGGTTVVSGNSIDDFSLSAFLNAPNIINADALQAGKPVDAKDYTMGLGMGCTPDGSTFSGPVTLKLKVSPLLAGKKLTIENQGEQIESVVQFSGVAEYKVNHFSLWEMLFNPDLVTIKSGEVSVLEQTDVPVTAGKNTYNYTRKIGLDYDVTGIIAFFIKNKFGEKSTDSAEQGSFTSSDSGKASIKVVQKYFDLTFNYGDISFTARVWGRTISTVTVAGSDPAYNGHSGGSGS